MERFREYYRRELDNLRNGTVEFEKKHPNLAIQLTSGAKDNDPDVERLLEGLAYLTANLQMKIDTELPVLANKLAEIVYPQILRIFPSMTVFKFTGKRSMKESQIITKGAIIKSDKVEDKRCYYSTYEDVIVKPFEVEKIEYNEERGKESLNIKIRSSKAISCRDLRDIEFYIDSPISVRSDFLYFVNNYIDEVEFICGESRTIKDGKKAIQTKLQYQNNESSSINEFNCGYHVLQRFFNCTDSFMMFRISGGEELNIRESKKELSIILHINSAYKKELFSIQNELKKKNYLQLNCVAGINLYGDTAYTVKKEEYTESCEVLTQKTYQHIYEVTKVSASFLGGRKEYIRSITKNKGRCAKTDIYETMQLRRSSDKVKVMIQLDSFQNDQSGEEISIELLCTDGDLAGKLNKESLKNGSEYIPSTVGVKNITKPTNENDPYLEENILWRFICQYNFNISSQLKLEDLKELLKMYVPQNKKVHSSLEMQRIDNLKGLTIKKEKRLRNGYIEKELVMVLGINDEYIDEKGIGDVVLFGDVLKYFLEMVRPLNNSLRLEIVTPARGRIGIWN